MNVRAVLHHALRLLLAAVVLTVFAVVCVVMVREGPLLWATAWIAAGMLLAAKGLLWVYDLRPIPAQLQETSE